MQPLVDRTLAGTIARVSASFPALLLTGPRQVGKTTLLEACAEPGRGYVTLDDLDQRALAQADPALFLQRHPPPVIIDEVQYAPQLFSAIRLVIDRARQPGLFWLTGSQKFHLMQGITESLAGRVAILDLLGLSHVDVDQKTVKAWLSILETSGLIYLLAPWHSNLTKRLVKTPKLYFLDTGLCAYLTQWTSPESLEAGAMSGPILETHVVAEILKGYWHNGRTASLFFYRDRDMQEIDLLIEQDNTLHPVEIKKTATPTRAAAGSFGVLDKLGRTIGEGAVLCLKETDVPLSRAVTAIPVWYL